MTTGSTKWAMQIASQRLVIQVNALNLLDERNITTARTEASCHRWRNIVRAGDTAVVRMVLVEQLARCSHKLVLGSSNRESLVLVVEHTRAATFVRLNLSTLGPGVLATASNLEGDGRLYRMRPTGYKSRD